MKIQKNKDYNLITHWIYHFFISTKLLISLNLQIILFVLLIDLPRKNKKGFIWVSVAIVLFLWTNTILLAKRVLQKSAAFHVKMKKVLLILATFILSYALLYYSIYNYDKDSFYWLIDKKDEELEKKENNNNKRFTNIAIKNNLPKLITKRLSTRYDNKIKFKKLRIKLSKGVFVKKSIVKIKTKKIKNK